MTNEPSESGLSRTAQIDRYNGKPVGVCIHLSPADLRALGIPLSRTTNIEYKLNSQQQKVEIERREGENN